MLITRRAKRVKTPSNGPAQGIKPATSQFAVKMLYQLIHELILLWLMLNYITVGYLS